MASNGSFLDKPGTGGGILPPYGSTPAAVPPPTHAGQTPVNLPFPPPPNPPWPPEAPILPPLSPIFPPPAPPEVQIATLLAPSLIGPIDDCQRSVTVAATGGSTVDLYVNGMWRGTSVAPIGIAIGVGDGGKTMSIDTSGSSTQNNDSQVEVLLTGCCLKIGDLVQATQTDPGTGQTSAFSSSVKVESYTKYSYLTQQYNMQRTGWYPYETKLNPSTTDWSKFKLRKTLPVDGKVYAQPLYMHHQYFPGLGGSPGEAHNVIYIATENDSVYAFDADVGSQLWRRSLLLDGQRSVTSKDVSCTDISPLIGISSTPVIDCGCHNDCQCSCDSGCETGCGCNATCRTSTMFVVSKSVLASNPQKESSFHSYLHAIDVITGLERSNSPVEITAQGFNPMSNYNRIGLLLLNGVIYVGFAGHCDEEPHGWVISYDATTLEQKNAFNTTPNGGTGGVWQGNTGLASDGVCIYFTTGNGTFDTNPGGTDFGDSVIKLSADLVLLSSFTPADQNALNDNDTDFGSGGVLILPDPQPGNNANLLVTCGKAGDVWVLDRNRLGGFSGGPSNDPPQPGDNPNIVSMFEVQPNVMTGLRLHGDNTPGIWGGPAYFNGPIGQLVIYCADVVLNAQGKIVLPGNLNAFLMMDGTFSRVGTSSENFWNGGATPVISSNQQADGIVWAIQRGDGTGAPNLSLCAYNALTLSTHGVAPNLLKMLPSFGTWQSGRAFIEPTVINGKVYAAYLDSTTLKPFVGVFF